MLDNRKAQPGIEVTTPNGSITAPKVLLAVNAFGAQHRKIYRRVAAIGDRTLMTEPLTPQQMESVGWENRQGIYDNNNNTDPEGDKKIDPYLRLAGYGGEDGFSGNAVETF